jgi:SAM-dependent methyltransferase
MSTPERPWQRYLACPICKSSLVRGESEHICSDPGCGARYPLVNGVPILINGARSVFAIDDFVARKATTFAGADPGGPARRPSLLRRLIPSNSRAVGGGNDQEFIDGFEGTDRWVLVIGSGDRAYTGRGSANLIFTDVHLGANVDLIADGHDLPFQDATLDGVLAISVLEHVADPGRCVAEIARVLKPGGRVLAATPFMQQVHLGRYDFTRFTHLGHRRLWRQFREIDSGITCGPGMALAWAWQYFLLSFSENPKVRKYLRAFAKLTSFPLPYFDEYLKDKAGAYDAASSFYFIGEKCDRPISDRELVQGYRGLDNLG